MEDSRLIGFFHPQLGVLGSVIHDNVDHDPLAPLEQVLAPFTL